MIGWFPNNYCCWKLVIYKTAADHLKDDVSVRFNYLFLRFRDFFSHFFQMLLICSGQCFSLTLFYVLIFKSMLHNMLSRWTRWQTIEYKSSKSLKKKCSVKIWKFERLLIETTFKEFLKANKIGVVWNFCTLQQAKCAFCVLYLLVLYSIRLIKRYVRNYNLKMLLTCSNCCKTSRQ